jgi:hypothetical protein
LKRRWRHPQLLEDLLAVRTTEVVEALGAAAAGLCADGLAAVIPLAPLDAAVCDTVLRAALCSLCATLTPPHPATARDVYKNNS